MLQAASNIAPRGVYVCGNTTTTSGLTVTLVKEGGSGDFALEAGALVLADQGMCSRTLDEGVGSMCGTLMVHQAYHDQGPPPPSKGVDSLMYPYPRVFFLVEKKNQRVWARINFGNFRAIGMLTNTYHTLCSRLCWSRFAAAAMLATF